MQSVDRESHQTKIEGLLAAAPDLIDEMEHNDDLQNAIIVINPDRLTMLKDISTLVGMLMNFLYLFNATKVYHYNEVEVPDWVVDSIEYLGYVQGASSLLLIFFYTINKK